MTYPSAIQAITIAETGGPEVLKKTEIPFPTVEPEHLVIKVDYFGINFIDTAYRRGIYPADKFPFVMGVEASGTVIRLPTDPAVLDDPDYQKRGYKQGSRVAVDTPGSHAQYISVSWRTLYPVPENIPASTAAASLIQGLTAISFMEESYNVQNGDIVLIHTIAGGVGVLMCQFAKYRGAIVIGTTSTKEKAELAKSNGADHVIIYKEEDTIARVLEITNGEGVHAIFDGVGKDTFEADFRMIRRKGTLVSMGGASGAVPPFPPLKLSEKNVTVVRPRYVLVSQMSPENTRVHQATGNWSGLVTNWMSNYVYTPSESLYYGNALFGLLSNSTLRPLIHKEYPFTTEGAREAQIDLMGGKTVGKLLIKVSG